MERHTKLYKGYCKQCGNKFSSGISWQIYCSKECRQLSRNNSGQRRWYQLRNRAKKRNQSCCTLDEFKNFYTRRKHICEYCEMPEDLSIKKYKRRIEIDKKDATKGYVIENLALACYKCNTVKNDILTYEEMKQVGHQYIKPKWLKSTQKQGKF